MTLKTRPSSSAPARVAPTDPTPPVIDLPDNPSAPDYGVRTFDEINATFSNITGVPITTASVAGTYATVKQQLPTVESASAFLASHQTGIAQLAMHGTLCLQRSREVVRKERLDARPRHAHDRERGGACRRRPDPP